MKRVRILAVDQEEIILKSIRKALKSNEKIEYAITTCTAALDAIKLLRSDKFDLVFVDLILPGMNGIELLRRIKNIYPNIGIIIMSGFSYAKTDFDLKKKGTSFNELSDNQGNFLLKPFTTDEIKSAVTRMIENQILR
jgi:DNA-binding NtrC family response regulator